MSWGTGRTAVTEDRLERSSFSSLSWEECRGRTWTPGTRRLPAFVSGSRVFSVLESPSAEGVSVILPDPQTPPAFVLTSRLEMLAGHTGRTNPVIRVRVPSWLWSMETEFSHMAGTSLSLPSGHLRLR